MSIKRNVLFADELSDPEIDEMLNRVINLFNPDALFTPAGVAYYSPGDVRTFDEMFERFGLTFRSSDDRFDDAKYLADLWYKLAEHIGTYVFCIYKWPKIAARRFALMPPGWPEYIRAVRENDMPTARRLAIELDIENPYASCPKQLME